ncbi:MAG: ABC transporter ATP-binding protein [Candidatus Omnitrophica bacterium]|nr:ABC transporter ATP-binding protein [Candidatus Omnitrophota bacterium]
MKNYIKLLSFLRGHYRLFSIAIVLMLLATIFEGIQLPLLVPLMDRIFNDKPIIIPNQLPDFLNNIVLQLNATKQETLFWIFPIILIILLIMKHVVGYFSKYYMNDVSQRIMRDIRDKLYKKIQNLSLEYFSTKRTGELISRITHDVNLVENALSYGLIDLFCQTFLIIIYTVIAFTIYPKGALCIFLIFPFIAIPMSSLGRRLRKFSKGIQEKVADINSLLLETISGVLLVKAYHAEDYEVKRFGEKNYQYYKLKMSSIKRLLAIAPMTEIFGAICGMFIIFWMGKLVMDEYLSSGVFILFFGAIMSIISPVKKLGNVNAIIQQALVANDRIYQILDAPIKVHELKSYKMLNEFTHSLKLTNVEFSYGEDSKPVLKNINLEIKKGELVALVGPTGTGKTTLVNLIPRFYDPTKGGVFFDGVDLREAGFKSLRDQIGIVTQDSILFNDSVRANIAYGNQNADESDIISAARKAFAHPFIEKMPKGYDTVIGDRGFRLSGGEKQRISIARAILKNAPILILDEATSQLDSESEKFVQEALDELMEGRTVIAIAHRLSTIQRADKIVVLEHGKIIGMGKHEDLLVECELYQRLYAMQFQASST